MSYNDLPPIGDVEAVCEVVDEKYNRVQFYRQTGDTSKPYHRPGEKLYDQTCITRLTSEIDRRRDEYLDLLQDVLDAKKLMSDAGIEQAQFSEMFRSFALSVKNVQSPIPNKEFWREHLRGVEVSIDVSTCDEDAGNRLFGTVSEVMDHPIGKNGFILLVHDQEPNFDVLK